MSATTVHRRGPVRHAEPPATPRAWLVRERYTLARRATQLLVLLTFAGTLYLGWSVAGQPLLAGNLSASKLAGVVPMADPFAVLQMLAARQPLDAEVLIGATLLVAFFGLLAGRAFCGWVCPMNLVTDAAAWTRRRLHVPADLVHLQPRTRYIVLVLALLLSALTGLAAFDWVSPVAALHRELLYGAGLGLLGAGGVFMLDAFVLKHGWCGHLCPLGACHAVIARPARLRLAFDDASCTHCGDCVKVCPEPRVLNFAAAAARGSVAPGECTLCGRCVAICPEHSLAFALRPHAQRVDVPVNPGEPR
jgi:ferredoxin-type protein NapH